MKILEDSDGFYHHLVDAEDDVKDHCKTCDNSVFPF